VIRAAGAAAVALALAAPATAAPPDDAGGACDAPLRPWARGATPALAGEDLSGRAVDLRALRGRVVLVQFWASWCEPCAAELPAIARLRARHADRGLAVLTVNHGEGAARAEAFLREVGADLPVLLDRDHRAARAWGVGGLPSSFLVDARGRVHGWNFGACDWTRGEPAAVLERLLAAADRGSDAARRSARGDPAR
jgi:thiol-disulfide isomerase/thioredoxin